MAKLVALRINNFRGIRNLEEKLDNSFICIVGRGDSGKSTFLEAISYVLSPNWNLSFYDTDFYNCETKDSIVIEATLVDVPRELISDDKFGLYLKQYADTDQKDEIDLSVLSDKLAITICLTVTSDLEPNWVVTSDAHLEPKPISSADRSKFNCHLMSDYVDRHFSWNKGSPLYSLKKMHDKESSLDRNLILTALRDAQSKISECGFEELSDLAEIIKDQASTMGMKIDDPKTSIDVRDLFGKDNKICLHDDLIPLRLKGKGSKRIISMAIQLALAKEGGIVLIDELEQGLEPNRIKNILHSLLGNHSGQIFITTHSRDAVVELKSELVLLMKQHDGESSLKKLDNIQGTVRACPEAFFAEKIIVCEGSTEVGLCRALDSYRIGNDCKPMATIGCEYVNGEGSSLFSRANEIGALFPTCLFCDSDTETGEKEKKLINESKVKVLIVDCDKNYSIEDQLMKDLPWEAVVKLINYVQRTGKVIPDDLLSLKDCKNGDAVARARIAKEAKDKDRKWFKRIDHGEFLGEVVFEFFDEMKDTRTRKNFETLSRWIDGNGS